MRLPWPLGEGPILGTTLTSPMPDRNFGTRRIRPRLNSRDMIFGCHIIALLDAVPNRASYSLFSLASTMSKDSFPSAARPTRAEKKHRKEG